MKTLRAVTPFLVAACLAPSAFTAPAPAGLMAVGTLSSPGRFDKYPSVAFDAEGSLWVAYTTTDGGNDRVI